MNLSDAFTFEEHEHEHDHEHVGNDSDAIAPETTTGQADVPEGQDLQSPENGQAE